MTAAYPLSWPPTMPRSKTRETGKFKTTLSAALGNVEDSLRRFAADSRKKLANVVISSNYSLGDRRPQDPGVAVWFVWDEMQVCIPVDRYLSIEANLQAVHHIIEARRTELRHGTLALVRATFQGFMALPSPGGSRHWSEVLGIARTATPDEIDAAWRAKAKLAHPDAGGSDAQMADINRARDEARKERS